MDRVTLTLPVLYNAAEVAVPGRGRNKAAVVREVIEDGNPRAILPAWSGRCTAPSPGCWTGKRPQLTDSASSSDEPDGPRSWIYAIIECRHFTGKGGESG